MGMKYCIYIRTQYNIQTYSTITYHTHIVKTQMLPNMQQNWKLFYGCKPETSFEGRRQMGSNV